MTMKIDFPEASNPLELMNKMKERLDIKPPTPPLTVPSSKEEVTIVPQPEPVKPRLEVKPPEPVEEKLPLPNIFEEKTPPIITPPAEPEPDDDEFPDANLDAASDKAKDHFKKLKSNYRKTKEELTTERTRADTVSQELEGYKTGQKFPDEIVKLNNRISQLEPFEKIVNLKLSPAYQEQLVKPVTEAEDQLSQIGADYNIPKSTMLQISKITNRAEQNRVLSQYFDDVGALEIKGILNTIQDLRGKMVAAEKEPEEQMAVLQQQFEERKTVERSERFDTFKAVASQEFRGSLDRIKTEGKAHELILKPNDPEFNRRFVTPVQDEAAAQYGRLITALGEAGLEKLPPELAKGLSEMVLRSIAHGIAVEARSYAEKNLREVRENSERQTPILRPRIGSGTGSQPSGDAGTVPMSAKDAASQSLQTVMKR